MMTGEELSWWMAYDRLEPFGEERADMRAAQVCSTLANINRSKETKPFTISDFMFRFGISYLEQDLGSEVGKVTANIQKVVHGPNRGVIRVYEGDAPPVRRLGKRGKSAKSGKRRF